MNRSQGGQGGKVKNGWSQSGTLTTGDSTKKVTLQANFPDPDIYTVQFQVQNPGGFTLGGLAAAPTVEAIITWSVEGNFVSRRVSVGNGTSVSGVGQACHVTILDNSAVGITVGDYGVSVQVSRGVRAATQQPPFLQLLEPTLKLPFFVVGPAAFVNVPVPPDAGAISALVTVKGSNAPIADQTVIVADIVGGVPAVQYDPRIGLWIPLAAATTSLHLINNDGARTFDFSVFLGIDG